MSFEVLSLKEAQADLEAIHSYLSKHSVAGVHSWLDALEKAIDALEEHPDRYARAPEDEFVSAPIQNLSLKNARGGPTGWFTQSLMTKFGCFAFSDPDTICCGRKN